MQQSVGLMMLGDHFPNALAVGNQRATGAQLKAIAKVHVWSAG